MSLQIAARRPARMIIVNVTSGAFIEAQFNPTEFTEALQVNYARQTIPGLSHQRLQYVNTNNVRIPLALELEALDPASSLDDVLSAKRFLQHLCYPRRGAQDVVGGGPPRVLFIWPQTISLNCVVTDLSFTYQRFNGEGAPVQITANVTLEEIRDVRLPSEDVLVDGSQRSGTAPGT